MDIQETVALVRKTGEEYGLHFEEGTGLAAGSSHSFYWQCPVEDHLSFSIDVRDDTTVRLLLVVSLILPGFTREQLLAPLENYPDLWFFGKPLMKEPIRVIGLPLETVGEDFEELFPMFLESVGNMLDFIRSCALDEYLQA